MGIKIKCNKCGDIIESKYRHDFVPCSCDAIFIDGGNDYLRMGGEAGDILMDIDGTWISMEEVRKNNDVLN